MNQFIIFTLICLMQQSLMPAMQRTNIAAVANIVTTHIKTNKNMYGALTVAAGLGYLLFSPTAVNFFCYVISRYDEKLRDKLNIQLHDAVVLHDQFLGSAKLCNERVKILLAQGADVNFILAGETEPLLVKAAREGVNMDIVEKLLKTKDIQVNKKDRKNGRNALMSAIVGDNIEMALRFLNVSGIDIDAIDNDGCTALMLAAGKGYKNLVEKLLEKYANIKLRNKNNHHVIEYVINLYRLELCANKNLAHEICKSITNHVRKLDLELWMALHKNNEDQALRLIYCGASGSTPEDTGRAWPIICAAQKRYIKVIRALCEAGMDDNHTDGQGRNAAWYIENANPPFELTEQQAIVQLLKDQKEKLRTSTNWLSTLLYLVKQTFDEQYE